MVVRRTFGAPLVVVIFAARCLGQPARRLRYVGSQARREPNQNYGRDRAPQPRNVENLFKRRGGIRGSRRRWIAVGSSIVQRLLIS